MSAIEEDKWLDHSTADRKVQILKSAQDLFAESSFRDTEVSDIANVAGMSKATIYKYFRSKDEILLSVVEENFKYIRDLVILRLITGSEPPLERFKAAAIDVARHLEQNRSFVLVLIQEAGQCMAEIQKIHHAVMTSNSKISESLFSSLKKEGEIPDIDSSNLIKVISDICIGSMYSWALTENSSLVQRVEFYFQFLFAKQKPA